MILGKVSRFLVPLACVLLSLYPGSFASAQQAPRATPRIVEARIVEAIDESRLTTLKGNTRPEARAENDRGPVSPNLPMSDLVLVLRRSPEQQTAFESLLTALQDPSSPQFHHWLTPDQIGQKYGPAASDIAAISQYLQNHGFRLDSVSKDHLAITFSGNAGQVEATFHTEIHNLQVNGEAHIANMSDPKIPEALTPVVVGVKALHNFFPRPQHKVGGIVRHNSNGTWDRIDTPDVAAKPETKSIPTPARSRQIVSPKFNAGGGSEDVSPYDFAAIYNVLPLWTAATPIDGTGQKIAIAGTSKILASDVATFRSAFGLPAIASLSQVVANGTDPGVCTGTTGACTSDDEYENTLDVEWSSAVAKGAGVVLVVSGSNATTTDTVYSSSSYIIDNNVAPVMSVSYGECELALGTSGNTAYSNLWSTANAAGIAVFVSSGDQGSAVCDAGGSSQSGTPYGAQYGLSVSGLSSTPYNTSVGGTDFAWGWDTNGQTTYWNTTSNSHLADAKGYIPEFPWNSTCSNSEYVTYVNSQLSSTYTAGEICDLIGTEQITSSGGSLLSLVDTVGGSGGASNCTVNSTTSTSTSIDPTSCSGGYAKPSWQTGVIGIPADGKRDIPDISFFAANGFSGSSYVVCVTAAGACTYTPGSEPVGEEVGGTSVSSPAMAGVMALINQKAGSAQGNPNTELYKLAAKETYSGCVSNNVPLTGSACVFNDITTGTIAMPCDVGSPNCTGTSQSPDDFGLLTGWASTAGYDLASGLGSLNVTNLVNAYAASGSGPVASLSPTSLAFPPTALGSTAAIQTVTLKNTGSADLASIAITIAGTDASSFSETDTCGTDLGAGSSCVITVTFKPAVAGAALTATLSIADDATGSPQTVALSGSTPTPSVSLNPPALTFPATLEGVDATPLSITLTNTGAAALTVTGVTIGGTNPTSFSETNTCTSVAASATCAITVTFKPAAAGALSAVLSIADNASDTPQTVTLNGTGTTPLPAVTLSPTQLTFPATNVGSSAPVQVVTLKNTGSASLTISGMTITGVDPSDYSETTTCTTVAANATCNISVTFKPNAGGNLLASLNIADNATGSPQTVGLSGTGVVVAPIVTLSANSLAFPSTVLGVAATPQVITVKNTGTAALTVSSVVLGGANPTSYSQTNTCTSVAVNATCAITVTFKPVAFGTLLASIALTDNASNSPQAIALTGVGIEAGSYSLSASAVSFSAGSGGSSTITATGTGGYSGVVTLNSCTLASGPTGAVNAPACTVGTSPITVPKNGTGTGTVNFTSTAPGSAFRKASLDQFRLFGEGAMTIAGLLILALPARRRAWRSMLNRTTNRILAVLILTSAIGLLSSCGGGSSKTYTATVSPTTLTFASTNVGSTAATQTVTLSNTGTGALSFSGAAIGGTNASSFTQTNTCASSLAASATCTITVSFAPTQTGALAGTLTVTDGATTGSPQTVTLTGTGASAGTTTGAYTYTVTGTDAAGVKQTATITVTVS